MQRSCIRCGRVRDIDAARSMEDPMRKAFDSSNRSSSNWHLFYHFRSVYSLLRTARGVDQLALVISKNSRYATTMNDTPEVGIR